MFRNFKNIDNYEWPFKRRAEENLGDEPCMSASTTKRPTRQSSGSRVYDPICIFCQKAKYLKRTSSREKLIKVTQLRVDQRHCTQ